MPLRIEEEPRYRVRLFSSVNNIEILLTIYGSEDYLKILPLLERWQGELDDYRIPER